MNSEGKWNGKLIRSPRLKKKTIDNNQTSDKKSAENFEKCLSNHIQIPDITKEKISQNLPTILHSIALTFEFKINKVPDEDFGFSVISKGQNKWFIESIIENSPTDRAGLGQSMKIKPGDQIKSINCFPLHLLNNPNFLNELPLLIRLRIQRCFASDDHFMRSNNIRSFMINVDKDYLIKLASKFEISETPIKNYIKVGKFIFESISSGKLISNDIIIQINNVEIFGSSIKEILHIISKLDDKLVLCILRQQSECNNHFIDQNSTLKTPLKKRSSNILLPAIRIDKLNHESKPLETIPKITDNFHHQQDIDTNKFKTNIGSIRRIRTRIRPHFHRIRKLRKKNHESMRTISESKSTMTEPLLGFGIEHSLVDSIQIESQSLPLSNGFSLNSSFEESEQQFSDSDSSSLFCSIESSRALVDNILKIHSPTSISWDTLENRNLFWNSVTSAFIGKFGLGISCEVYKGFPIVNNFHKVGVASISRKINLGDLLISLNETLMVNKSESDVNMFIKSVPQGLVSLRIIRNATLKERPLQISAKNEHRFPKNMLQHNLIDLSKGAVLKLEIEKTNVIGFFIDGGSGQPIFIKKMYSGSSGSKMGILLRPGDIIISVNNIDFQNISHGDGFKILQELKPGKYEMEIFRKF